MTMEVKVTKDPSLPRQQLTVATLPAYTLFRLKAKPGWVGIIVPNSKGGIILWLGGAHSVGWDPVETHGDNLAELLPPDEAVELRNAP